MPPKTVQRFQGISFGHILPGAKRYLSGVVSGPESDSDSGCKTKTIVIVTPSAAFQFSTHRKHHVANALKLCLFVTVAPGKGWDNGLIWGLGFRVQVSRSGKW